MITGLIAVNAIGLFINNILKSRNREITLLFSIVTMYMILYIILIFNENNNEYQNREVLLGYYTVGLDGINLLLLGIIGILDPILILLGKKDKVELSERKLMNKLIGIKLILIILFVGLDIFLYYLTFELVLIPLFLIITRYGSKYQFNMPRMEAGIRLFLYTIGGSLLLLAAIIIIFIKFGTTGNELLLIKISNSDSGGLIILLWALIFFSFLIKIPMFPLHTWLPLAHSDAPTIGSMILAGVILKLASLGILRYSLYIYNPLHILDSEAGSTYNILLPVVFTLALISVLYSSLVPIRGIFDLKKIIAYSSVVHMNISIFGLFSKDVMGIIGGTFLMLTHALISCGLFLLIGIIYKRYHTRYLPYYHGVGTAMPVFGSIYLLFTLANISLPFCSSFIAELFILIGTFSNNKIISIILLLSLFLSTSFILRFTNKFLFGKVSPYIEETGSKDLTILELSSVFPLLLFTMLFAFHPQGVISLLNLPCLLLT